MKVIILLAFLTTSLIIIPLKTVLAIDLFLPFGGKVISTEIPGVTCHGSTGPIIIIPNSALFPSTPYVVTRTTKKYLHKKIQPGVFIIGLYSPVMLPLCETNTEPPAPFFVFPIIMYGVSKL